MKHLKFLVIVVLCTILASMITSLHTKIKLKSKSKSKAKAHTHMKTHMKTHIKLHMKTHMSKVPLVEPGMPGFDQLPKPQKVSKELEILDPYKEPLANTESIDQAKDKYETEVINAGIQLNDWLTISSDQFKNYGKFPPIVDSDDTQHIISVSQNFQRINHLNKFTKKYPPTIDRLLKNNPMFKGTFPPIKKEQSYWFWFRLSEKYMYYASSSELVNELGTFYFDSLEGARDLAKTSCFQIQAHNAQIYTICAEDNVTKLKWLCFIEKAMGPKHIEHICGGKGNGAGAGVLREKTIIQPLIMIPTASKNCNTKWGYKHHGKDWECKCREGI